MGVHTVGAAPECAQTEEKLLQSADADSSLGEGALIWGCRVKRQQKMKKTGKNL
jgi:hypothetical protein